MPSNFIRERAGTPPFIKPFLVALDRMQERRPLRPEEVTERARALLSGRLGEAEAPVSAAFSYGATGLLGSHTHYFDGFALLLSLPLGTAVVVRPGREARSTIVFEGSARAWTFEAGPEAQEVERWPSWARLVSRLVRRFAPEGQAVDVAVVSTVHASCMDAYMSSLGVATARALQAAFAVPKESRGLLADVRELVAECMACPFGIAYVLAADAGGPEAYSLVDAHTLERLPLDAPASEHLGWALVDVGGGPLREAAFYRKRQAEADEALRLLRADEMPELRSLRDLEHRDLQRALDALPRSLRPVVRHLVTENRRVQKLVGAVRRRDWQMFGALLLMSHASLRNDWKSTSEPVDHVVEHVENMSIEGMYGACMTGRGGCVLVLGQPFVVPRCLDRIQEGLGEHFDVQAEVILL